MLHAENIAPRPNAASIQRSTLFALWSSCLQTVDISRSELVAHQTPIFFFYMKWIISENSALQYRLFWEFTCPRNESQNSY